MTRKKKKKKPPYIPTLIFLALYPKTKIFFFLMCVYLWIKYMIQIHPQNSLIDLYKAWPCSSVLLLGCGIVEIPLFQKPVWPPPNPPTPCRHNQTLSVWLLAYPIVAVVLGKATIFRHWLRADNMKWTLLDFSFSLLSRQKMVAAEE